MGTYAISGSAEVDVTVGGQTYRAYTYSLNKGGNSVSARAFVDDPDDEAIVMTSKFRDLSIGFRNDITDVFDVDDVVEVSVTLATETYTYSCKITAVNTGAAVDGIADFSITARVLPAQAS